MVPIPTEGECLKLLQKYNLPPQITEHSKAVTDFVKKLSMRVEARRNLLIAGAMLHDIGKSQTNSMKHGFIGGRILRGEEIDESVIKIVERHVGIGLTKAEAEAAGLPPRDFIPQTIEEKLVCYADKLVLGTYIANLKQARIDFTSKLPPNHPALERWDTFMSQMEKSLGEPDKRFEVVSKTRH